MQSTLDIFRNHTGRKISKWPHYFSIYDRHFSQYVNKHISVWEIGVFKGGSLQLWKKFFGENASIIGIDIDPNAYFEEPQIKVHIGDQTDLKFLKSLIDLYGFPDIVIDDGGHHQFQVNASFKFLYPLTDYVYLIEDTHTAYWLNYGGGLRKEGTIVENSKKLIDELTGKHYNNITNITLNTNAMHFYDSVIVFEKKKIGKLFL